MATKIFIIDNDYQRMIQDEILTEIIGSATLRECEEAAIEEMVSYLNARYDISNLFPATQKWNARMLYQPGDYQDYNGTFVRALKPTDTEPDSNRGQAPTGAALSTDGKVGEGIFWTDYCFPNIKDYDNAETLTTELVAAGVYRGRNNQFWKAKTTVNGTPAEGADWTEEDPRNQLLVELCCKLALYKAHARISPNQIPELRVQEHDMSIDWLKEAAAGKVAPQLPVLDEDDENKEIVQFGGLTRKYYTF